jgi:polyisoprenoid-binding protein YceI
MIIIVASTLAMSASALADSKYEAGSYQLDPAHSKIGFEIPHLVISTVEGKFNQAEGAIDLNEKFEKSKAKITVDIASIDTGVVKRDGHLKSPDFFDAEKYPKMSFESTSIAGTPDSFKLTGNLTIKGITKQVAFDGKYLGTVMDGFGNQKAAFNAKAKISRKDFGLTWNNMVEAGPVVGDEVTIELRVQAGRPAPKKAAAL